MNNLFLLSLFGGAVVQRLFGRVVVSIFVPIFCYVAWSVYNQFFVPYHGGGASFWPIDIIFAGPVAGVGGFIGSLLAIKFFGARNDTYE
jgi:hypothetical protein